MKKSLVAVFVSLAFAFALTGCCTSLMCQAKQVASAQLGCADDMKITNVTSQVAGAQGGQERYLQVDACGKQVQVSCQPTNVEKRVKRYREDVVERQSRLDLKWKCQSKSNLAQK